MSVERRRGHGGAAPLHREGYAGQRRRGALLVVAGLAEARSRSRSIAVPRRPRWAALPRRSA
eukprot:12272857-Heterocapsa_arctica.AAC.1